MSRGLDRRSCRQVKEMDARPYTEQNLLCKAEEMYNLLPHCNGYLRLMRILKNWPENKNFNNV